MTWRDMTGQDVTWRDMTWRDVTLRNMTWRDMTWHEVHHVAWRDMTWRDMTWHNATWRDMTRRDVTPHDVTWRAIRNSTQQKWTLLHVRWLRYCRKTIKTFLGLKLFTGYTEFRHLHRSNPKVSKIQIFSPNWANGSQLSLNRSGWNFPEM